MARPCGQASTCSYTGAFGEEGRHAKPLHVRKSAIWEAGSEHLPALQQECFGCAAKLQLVMKLHHTDVPLTEHSPGTATRTAQTPGLRVASDAVICSHRKQQLPEYLYISTST